MYSTHVSEIPEMRARDVLNALERVTLFRAQAADSYRRVDDIGGDLDSAISLLDLRRQSREAVDGKGSSHLLCGFTCSPSSSSSSCC